MHRLLRLSAFAAGLLTGGLAVLFAFDNPARIALSLGSWRLQAVPLWAIATVPLVAGIAAGYLYHLPARLHHFEGHMKHRALVHELRKEKDELLQSLDGVLAMPNDDSPATVAAPSAAPPNGTLLVAGRATAQPRTHPNGRGERRAEPGARPRGEALPDAMREAIAAAAAAMPAPARAHSVTPDHARGPATEPTDPNR